MHSGDLKRAASSIAIAMLCVLFTGCVGLLYFDDTGAPSRGNASAGATAGTVVVQRGDTLYSIAFRNNLDYRQLASWNGIGPDYTIYPGQRLRLTPPTRTSVSPASVAAQPPVASVGTTSSGPSPPLPAQPISPPVPAPVVVAPTPPAAAPVMPVVPAPVYVPGAGSAVFDVHRWQWPAQGRIVDRFKLPGQKGIDIGGTYGANVVAAAPGVVVYSGNALKGYGELVIIKHSDDYLSAYGFNSRRVVREGESVRAGQLIAQMGEGPGQIAELHFEIRYKGQPVDPLKYLPAS